MLDIISASVEWSNFINCVQHNIRLSPIIECRIISGKFFIKLCVPICVGKYINYVTIRVSTFPFTEVSSRIITLGTS